MIKELYTKEKFQQSLSIMYDRYTLDKFLMAQFYLVYLHGTNGDDFSLAETLCNTNIEMLSKLCGDNINLYKVILQNRDQLILKE